MRVSNVIFMLGFIVLWIILQTVILPRAGVST